MILYFMLLLDFYQNPGLCNIFFMLKKNIYFSKFNNMYLGFY